METRLGGDEAATLTGRRGGWRGGSAASLYLLVLLLNDV